MATGTWWVIGFFAAEPESLSQDINGEPPTGVQYLQGTSAQAQKAAGIAVNGKAFGPYATKAAAQAAVKAGKVTGDKTAGGALITGAAIPGVANIGAFFDRLGQAATWIRVVEIILGGALILAGVAKLMSGTAAGEAAGTALKVAAL